MRITAWQYAQLAFHYKEGIQAKSKDSRVQLKRFYFLIDISDLKLLNKNTNCSQY
jgi:hypothetical protein